MIAQLDGQLDLLELLEVAGGEHLNEPYYQCVCGGRLACDAPAADVAHYSIKHRKHWDEFGAAQWPGGRENHPYGKHYGPLLTIDGDNLAATLTTKAPHPVSLGMRYTCPCCLTNWGELKPEVQERHRAEHEEVEPGICRRMLWIQGKLDALHRGEYGGMLVWTDDSKAEHLANVTRNRDLTWAHYNERSSPNGLVQGR